MITKLELKRQVFHIFLGIGIVTLIYFDVIGYLFLMGLFLIGIIISFASKRYKIPGIYKLLIKFDRKKDIKTLPGRGALFYILGCAISVLLFEKNIALASIMILAFGDSVSRLVGPYGYLKHPFHSEKFLEGLIAGAIAAFLAALMFVTWILR